jgi:hypothetical protein
MSASYGYLTIIFPNEPWCLLQVIGHRNSLVLHHVAGRYRMFTIAMGSLSPGGKRYA